MFDIFRSKKTHLRAISREALAENSYTPDLPVLEQSSHVLLFEYGDLRQGFTHHKMIGDDLKSYCVTHDYFYLWCVRKGEGSFPLASKIGGINAGRTRIRGELYRVPADHVSNIDRHRENGVKFRRKQIRVLLPSGESMLVWAYIAIDAYWKQEIQWDNQFYRGNGGSTYAPMNHDLEDLKRPFLGHYTEFTEEHLRERNAKCYIGFTNGARTDDS